MRKGKILISCLVWLLIQNVPELCASSIVAVDDLERQVRLEKAPERIVSLSPHLTEMLFALGQGKKVVGTVRFSDYPEQALDIPRVGDAFSINIEALVALKPDLVVIWADGGGLERIDQIEKTGIAVYVLRTRTIEAVVDNLNDLSQILRLQERPLIIDQIKQQITGLKNEYSNKKKLKAFFQIWHEPLWTVGKNNIVTQVLEICSAPNVFSDLSAAASEVSIEEIVKREPELILISSKDDIKKIWKFWNNWQGISAVSENRVIQVAVDELQRPSPRIIKAAGALCRQIDKYRQPE